MFWILITAFYNLQNTHIHTILKPDIWEQHNNVLFDGGLYQIINVRVRESVGIYRPVTNPKIINILPFTVVNLYEHDEFVIPFQNFELKPLGDLDDLFLEKTPSITLITPYAGSFQTYTNSFSQL